MEQGLFRATLLAWASVQAEVLGRKQCRKIAIGAMIRKLREGLADNAVGPLVAERREAADLLEMNCRCCGKCSIEEIRRAA